MIFLKAALRASAAFLRRIEARRTRLDRQSDNSDRRFPRPGSKRKNGLTMFKAKRHSNSSIEKGANVSCETLAPVKSIFCLTSQT